MSGFLSIIGLEKYRERGSGAGNERQLIYEKRCGSGALSCFSNKSQGRVFDVAVHGFVLNRQSISSAGINASGQSEPLHALADSGLQRLL
jgi:hypothetical protein